MESIIRTSPARTRSRSGATCEMEAVRDWLSSGKSAAVIAEEPGLSRTYTSYINRLV